MIKSNKNGIIIPLNACLPTLDINISIDCLTKSKKNFKKLIIDKNIETIIIGLNFNHKRLVDTNGNYYFENISTKLTTSLKNLIYRFLNAEKKVILIGPISTPKYNFPLDYSRNLFLIKN